MIELYDYPTPNAWKVSIMLEECGLPYEIKHVDILSEEQFKPEFLAISPNNKIPAIVDTDAPWGGRQSVFESGAILIYLADKVGKFLAPSGRKRLEALEWTFWQAASLGPMCGQANHFRNYMSENTQGVERYTKEATRLYGVLDRRLKGRHWIVDDYGIADMMCWGWVWFHKMHGQNLDDFPEVKRWFYTMSERPAVKKGKAVTVELASDSMKVMYAGPYWSPQPLDPKLLNLHREEQLQGQH
jgi:GST-like protein